VARWPLSLFNRRRVLVVADDALLLATATGGSVELELQLPFGEDSDLTPLLEALRRRRYLPLVVFMDVLQQSYRREVLPKVSFFDQPRVVSRRLDLTFPQSDLRAAMRMPGKSEESGPSRVEYLLAALPKSTQIDRLFGTLAANGIGFTSICLLPIEAMSLVGALAERLPLPDPPAAEEAAAEAPRWTILVSPQRTGGIRQLVTKDGRLVLSRLTPDPTLVEEADPAGGEAAPAVRKVLGAVIAEELEATLGYVSRLGYNRREGLRVVALCDGETGEALRAAALPLRDLQCLTPAEAGRKLGLSGVDPDGSNRGDLLFVAWLGRRLLPVMPMLSPEQRKRRRVATAAAAATLLLLATALHQGVEVGQRYLTVDGLEEQRQAQQRLLGELRGELQRETGLLGDFPVSAAVVTRALELYHSRLERRPAWADLVGRIGAVNGPDQQLTDLVWRREAGQDRVTLELTYRLAPDRELEQVAAQTERILEELRRRFPESRVTVREHAVDFTADQALRGGAGTGLGAGRTPPRPLLLWIEEPMR